MVNLFIVYELDTWSQDLNVALIACLEVYITKNADTDKYFCSWYGIRFDFWSLFSIPNFDWIENVAIFGANISSSVHSDDKENDILVLSKGQIQGLNGTTFTVEAEYYINFSRWQRKFYSSLQYNGSNSFLFVKIQSKRFWNKKNILCV